MPHTVKAIDTVWVDLPLRPIPARNMRREVPHWTLFEICQVTLDSGVVGLGETRVYYTWGAGTISDEVKRRVIGRHPAELMWDDSLGAGMQMALFDAAAKILDVPLHQLLGRMHRDRCHVSWWDIDMPTQDWISECQLAMANGYTSFKTKARPWFDLVENTRQLCQALPPHFEVDMDFNGFGVDTAHCTRLLKELEQFPQIVMFESPIPHSDVAGYRHLRQHTHVPISLHTPSGFNATWSGDTPIELAIREEMADGFVLCGGASRLQRDALVCQAHNRSFFLQLVGTKITAAFALHLGAVLENARWPSVNCHQLFEQDCVRTALPVENGLCAVPSGPGLGIELDNEAIERFRTAPRPKPFPYPEQLLAIRWPTGTTTYYNHAAQYWGDWLGGRLPFFPRGVFLEAIPNDGSRAWRELFERAERGAVHSVESPF
jgi:L-alanine-DL-glutamate epimerase-like enolase superfamily enzyme